MPRIDPKDKLLTLKEKMKQLANQAAAIEARQKEQDRKDDTRRKVISGALALEHMAANPQSEFAKVFGRLLNEYVKRPSDRALFPSLADTIAPEDTGTLDRYLESRPVLGDAPAGSPYQEAGE